ncbi:MAG: N-acetyltransferase family protein [Gammaproteobacteria bacterium]
METKKDEQISLEIRHLEENDWETFKEIRLLALQLSPEEFASSYEEEENFHQVDWKQALKQSEIYGAFVNTRIVGITGFFVYNYKKMEHKGMFFGMFVKPDMRGKGIGNQLMSAIIRQASKSLSQLHCMVVASNKQALALYKKFGFEKYGTESNGLKVGDVYYDLHLLALKLK